MKPQFSQIYEIHFVKMCLYQVILSICQFTVDSICQYWRHFSQSSISAEPFDFPPSKMSCLKKVAIFWISGCRRRKGGSIKIMICSQKKLYLWKNSSGSKPLHVCVCLREGGSCIHFFLICYILYE